MIKICSLCVLGMIFTSCANFSSSRCSQSFQSVLDVIYSSNTYSSYADKHWIDSLSLEKRPRLYPERVMIGFHHLNDTFGSGSNLNPDSRFTSEAMEAAFNSSDLSLFDCVRDRSSNHVLLVTSQIDDLIFAVLYDVNASQLYYSGGFFNIIEGHFVEFLLKVDNDDVFLLYGKEFSSPPND